MLTIHFSTGKYPQFDVPTLGPRRARQHRRTDRPRKKDVTLPDGPRTRKDAHLFRRYEMLCRSLDDRLDVVGPECLLSTEGTSRRVRRGEGEVLRARE